MARLRVAKTDSHYLYEDRYGLGMRDAGWRGLITGSAEIMGAGSLPMPMSESTVMSYRQHLPQWAHAQSSFQAKVCKFCCPLQCLKG